MELTSFFFDTYALYEILLGNQAYKKYDEHVSFVTTRLNLMELYYGLLRKYGKKTAGEYYGSFLSNVTDIDDETIKEAMEFRLENAHRDLSYVDCVGYALARRNGLLFLTGDKAFKDLPGVEYVK